MAHRYIVKIRPNNFSCIEVKATKEKVLFEKIYNYENIDELKKFIKNKKDVTYLLFETEFLNTTTNIDKVITDKSTIQSVISINLKKDKIDTSNLNYTYSTASESDKKNSINYNINGIYLNTKAYQKYTTINTNSNPSKVSLENYALYSFAKQYINDKTFITIWMDENTLTIVAGDKDELYFSRNEDFTKSYDEKINIVNKNIAFAKQRARGVKFDTLTINDTVLQESSFYKEVYEKAQINLSSLIPSKDKFENFTAENFNKSIIEIGSLSLDYKFDFTPKSIRSKVQFKQSLNILIPLLTMVTLFLLYDTYEKYERYDKVKTNFEQNLKRLEFMYPELRYNFKNKKTLNYILKTIKENQNKDLIEQLTLLKESTEYINSSELNLDYKVTLDNFYWKPNSISVLQFHSNKKFNSLLEMNQFKNIVRKANSDLKNKAKIEVKYNPNKLDATLGLSFVGKSGNIDKAIQNFKTIRRGK